MKFENCAMLLPGHTVGFGTLETEGGLISRIDLTSREPRTANRLILPGLVNCHGHTPMTLLRGVGGGLPLQRWLTEAIFPIEAKMSSADVRAGAVWGAFEMLAGGMTCVADMYEFPDETAGALLETGLRGRICKVGFGFIPNRLSDCIGFTRSWNARMEKEAKGDVLADLCVHSEYLTDEAFCRALAAANNSELRRPLHVHVSETEKEHRECLVRHGKTPVAYLADTGLLDCGGYAAHGVWCTDGDFRIMAEKGVSLVHNPSSNMKLGSGFARILRAKELGVNVALGTDGCASNDNLDLFEEMHLASLIHKGVSQDPTALPPWEVIDLATANGARALQMPNIGELAVGKAADLCIVDLDRFHLAPCVDIPNLVVHSMHASDVMTTVANGAVVYDRGKEGEPFAAPVGVAAAKRRLIESATRLKVFE